VSGSAPRICSATNAGVGGGGLIADQTLADWEWVLGVNLWGVIYGLHSFLPMLLANSDGGHVVNTASVAGLLAGAGIGPYNASKSAVVAISETLRKELDMSAADVGVSVLCPGYVRTNIFESQRNRPETLRNPARAAGDARVRNDALKRVLDIAMDPAEVAGMVHDAVVEDRFWVITHPEFLKPISERADDIVAGTNPRPGRFDE
jgi:NAD(P)-dependent dehydrogenase (short-subunit alcohol dehydrogenase family)